MGGAPEGGGPPKAAIQRGPCPKVLAEFDRRPLAGARGRLLCCTLKALAAFSIPTRYPAGAHPERSEPSIEHGVRCMYHNVRAAVQCATPASLRLALSALRSMAQYGAR